MLKPSTTTAIAVIHCCGAFFIMTAVEFLAEKYNYITWMRSRDEISAGTADEWRAKFLKEAKDMERNQHGNTWDAAIKAHDDRGHVFVRSTCDFDDYEIS